jgi:hypothetical protein
MLTITSDNPAVARGVKAVNIIYGMTSRIPHLMNQSHLESNEGKRSYPPAPIIKPEANLIGSLVRLLATYLPGTHHTMHESVP